MFPNEYVISALVVDSDMEPHLGKDPHRSLRLSICLNGQKTDRCAVASTARATIVDRVSDAFAVLQYHGDLVVHTLSP
jgi:hypothetical protein